MEQVRDVVLNEQTHVAEHLSEGEVSVLLQNERKRDLMETLLVLDIPDNAVG